MGRTPNFWWDFAPGVTDAVIVQSDWPGGGELARFTMPDEQSEREGLEPQIIEAERLIADFKAGRKTPAWGKRPNAGVNPRREAASD